MPETFTLQLNKKLGAELQTYILLMGGLDGAVLPIIVSDDESSRLP